MSVVRDNHEPEAEVFRLRLSSEMAEASSALSLASGEADDATAEGSFIVIVLWKPECGVIIVGGKCERDPVDDIARGRLWCIAW